MLTRLFNRGKPEAYQLVNSGTPGTFAHTFGGEACHQGTVPPGCPGPVHLFYNLDLSDPRLGVGLRDPKVTRLPLYYALGNQGGPFRYRVASDARIELLCQPYPEPYRAGILKEYPEPFGRSGVVLDALGYSPRNPEDVWHYGGVLGIDWLTARMRETLRKRLEQWHLKNIGCPLVEAEEGEPEPTLEEIVAGCTPFRQGPPREKCPNPACEQHGAKTPLPPLLLLEPNTEDSFYQIIAGGDGGQLIWQVCRECGGVVATNTCT